jgi:phage shock protein C
MRPPGDQSFYRGSDRIIGGVCSGLAAGLHISSLWVRIGFVLLAFIQGIGVFIYIILWLVMPERIEGGPASRSGVDSMTADVRRLGVELRSQFAGWIPGLASATPLAGPTDAGEGQGQPPSPSATVGPNRQSLLLGVTLVGLGMVLLAVNTGLITWAVVWPVGLILLGLVFLVRTMERKS